MTQPQPIEILSPAGSLEKLRYALAFGADAVYAGVPFFSLRARTNEFDLESLEIGINEAHAQNKKLYLTANIFARNKKIKPFMQSLEQWVSLKPDALIMSDPGLILLVREKYPEVPIHLSVQANCMNWQSVRFWQQQGVQRIILSRELHINEIKEIKQRVPDMELEAFVHGAICIAYSGRCLMSSYMSYRDANQGVCDNSCREKFNVFETRQEANKDYYIEDLRQKGEFYQIEEDENGTFLMNSKDLRLIEHIKELVDAGVCSLKIEGRTKSVYYVSLVTKAYRGALNDVLLNKSFDPKWEEELNKIANRGYHKGFLLGDPGHNSHNYGQAIDKNWPQRFSGLIKNEYFKFENKIPFEVRGPLSVGERVEIINSNSPSEHLIIQDLINDKGEPVKKANPGQGIFHFNFNKKVDNYSIISTCVDR